MQTRSSRLQKWPNRSGVRPILRSCTCKRSSNIGVANAKTATPASQKLQKPIVKLPKRTNPTIPGSQTTTGITDLAFEPGSLECKKWPNRSGVRHILQIYICNRSTSSLPHCLLVCKTQSCGLRLPVELRLPVSSKVVKTLGTVDNLDLALPGGPRRTALHLGKFSRPKVAKISPDESVCFSLAFAGRQK